MNSSKKLCKIYLKKCSLKDAIELLAISLNTKYIMTDFSSAEAQLAHFTKDNFS